MRQVVLLVLTALAPLILFRGWLFLTDPITDRPPNPYGFFVFTASLTSVFLPVVSPLREAWQNVLHTDEAVWEGYSYVGIMGVLAALLTLLRVVQRLRRKQWRRVLRPVLPPPLRTAVWAAILLLLLAMAFPFRLPGGERLLDFLGPLKQFRSLGRFAWVFYYVFTLYAAYYFYRLYRYLGHHRAAGFGRTLLALLMLAWAGEALLTISTKARQIRGHESVHDFISEGGNYREKLSGAGHYAEDYQAILALPFWSTGTDKLDIVNSEIARFESYKASLNMGVPLLNSYMTRTSITQALRHFQLLGSDLIPKQLVNELPSKKPVLLLVTHEYLQPYEQRLVDKSRKLYEDSYVKLYELSMDSLASTSYRKQIASFATRRAQLVPGPDSTFRTTAKGIMLQTFADQPAPQSFLRPGAFTWPDGFAQLYRGPLPAPADTGMYEVSVWVSARTPYGLGNMQVKQYDQAGQMVDHQVYDSKRSTEIYGDWVRAVLPFRVRDASNSVEVLYENKDLIADELLIRPKDPDVYYFTKLKGKRQLTLNNYPLGN
jgi:hypothetical protein